MKDLFQDPNKTTLLKKKKKEKRPQGLQAKKSNNSQGQEMPWDISKAAYKVRKYEATFQRNSKKEIMNQGFYN